MTEPRARLVLAALSLTALVAGLRVGFSGYWGDAATYHAMASSLAYDRDIQYEAKDIYRIRREMGTGPEGLFLKRAAGGLTHDDVPGFPFFRRVRPEENRLYFAKPFLYPLVGAPFVRVFGTRGLYLLNALSLVAALVFGYAAARRDRSPAASLMLIVAVILGTVIPVYMVWLSPELFYVGLVTAALAAWRYDRGLLAALLLGAATYAKPPHIFIAIPVIAAPLFTADRPLVRRLLDGVARGTVLIATTLVLFFGCNVALTGEWNYQSGVRKTFYRAFPFEVSEGKNITFGNSGFWMTTPGVGPQAQGEGAPPPTPRTEPPRPASELHASFIWNLAYFWIGRFGGAAAYFLPVVAGIALLALRLLRDRVGRTAVGIVAVSFVAAAVLLPEAWYGGGHVGKWALLGAYLVPLLAAAFLVARTDEVDGDGALSLCALLATFVFYIWLIPDNWYGGSGTIGNRYFLTLVPLALFIAPRGLERWVGLSGVVSVAVFLWPLFVSPFYHSVHPGAHAARRASFRRLPAELTMLNDLSIFQESWRKRVDYGDTGDDHKHWPAEPTAYRLYFPDDGTFGREAREGVTGFWLRGGENAEVLLRAFDLKPLERVRIAVTGGAAGDDVSIHADGGDASFALAPGETKEAVFPAGRGFPYKETYVHVLHFRSRRGGLDALQRSLGTFVAITLEVKRERR